MEYLLAWRMAVAKDLLRRHDFRLDEVAERVGYGSASTFSTAFSRHVGSLRVATRASVRTSRSNAMVFWQTASASPSVKMKREQAGGDNQRER